MSKRLGVSPQLIEGGVQGYVQHSSCRQKGSRGRLLDLGSIKIDLEEGTRFGARKRCLASQMEKASDIPNVPNAIDYAKTPEAKAVNRHRHANSAILRAYALRQSSEQFVSFHGHSQRQGFRVRKYQSGTQSFVGSRSGKHRP